MSDMLVLEVRRLAALVAELLDEQQHVHRRLLEREDRRTGAALVPLLAEAFGTGDFTAAAVAAHALNARDAAGQALRELVGEYATERGGVRAFGRLLVRLEGVTFDGHRLVSMGQVRGVARWRVRVSEAVKPAALE
jgi:hypothetical protein